MTDRPSPSAALTAVLIGFFGLILFSIVTSLLSISGATLGYGAYILSVGVQGVLFAVPALVYYRKHPQHCASLRLNPVDPLCMVLIILSAVVGMLALNWVSIYWTMILDAMGLVTDTGNSAAPRTFGQLMWILVASAAAPAIFEEILFRGFLLPSMESIGKRKAVLISGGMFALMHGRIEALPAHLLLGTLLCLLVLRTDSLLSAVVYHVVYNASLMIMAYISLMGNPASLGGMPSVEASLQYLPVVILELGAWGWLTYEAMHRGMEKREAPTLPATRKPLPRLAMGLLIGTSVLLVAYELYSLILMIPGGLA